MKISILTPSYNSGQYIGRAIESVMNQSYSDWEHIIMDGGSTDETIDVFKKYPHLIWVSEEDKGQADAMEKAFKMAKGDIIVYLNADDWFDEQVFEVVIEKMSSSNASIVIGNGTFRYPNSPKENRWNSASTYKECLLHFRYKFPLNPFSYFYKREVQHSVGGFDVDNHYTMDYAFLLKILLRFKAVKVERNFGFYFFDGDNKSSNRNHKVDCRNTVIRHCLKHDIVGLLFYYYQYYLLSLKKGILRIIK